MEGYDFFMIRGYIKSILTSIPILLIITGVYLHFMYNHLLRTRNMFVHYLKVGFQSVIIMIISRIYLALFEFMDIIIFQIESNTFQTGHIVADFSYYFINFFAKLSSYYIFLFVYVILFMGVYTAIRQRIEKKKI